MTSFSAASTDSKTEYISSARSFARTCKNRPLRVLKHCMRCCLRGAEVENTGMGPTGTGYRILHGPKPTVCEENVAKKGISGFVAWNKLFQVRWRKFHKRARTELCPDDGGLRDGIPPDSPKNLPQLAARRHNLSSCRVQKWT